MKIKKLAAVCLAGALTASVLGGCGINQDEIVASCNDTEVTLGVANFMCRFQQAYIDEAYRSYFGDDVWDQDLYGNGSTMEESLKTDMMELLHEMYTLKAHMADYGVEITDEEQQKINDAAAAFMENNPEDTLKEIGATEDNVKEMLTLYTIREKMYAAIIADADTNVSDEEANMRGYTYVTASLTGYYDSSSNYVSYTDEEIAQIREDFDAMAEAVAENPASFETAAEALEYSPSETAYGAEDTTLDEAVKEVLDGLGEGEVSGVIETEDSLYIVRLDSETDEDATEENRQSIIEDRQNTLYDDTLSGWQEDDGWTVDDKALAKIKFDSAFAQMEDTEESVDAGTEE